MNYPRRSRSSGITFIDTVIGAALMLIVFVGIAAAFKLSIDAVTNNKARAGAIALGDERLEYIRSLQYNSIGTAGGIPAGELAASEDITLNGVNYTRRTFVEYADDPQDGLAGADTNGIIIDYKAVKVDLIWRSRSGERHVVFVTRITPPGGVETPCASCGTLNITVTNTGATPISNATVRVVNSTTNPAIDVTTYTDSNGIANFIGAPSAPNYQVFASKTGYSSDQTYTSSPANPNPVPSPLTVSNNLITSATFRIDLLATKNIYTFTTVLSGTWNDFFSDTTKIATSTSVEVSGGSLGLIGGPSAYESYGEFQSIVIGPSDLAAWGTLTINETKPAQTDITYKIYDGSGSVLIPDGQLPGNSAGLATSTIDLSGISTTTYPAIRVDATLSSSDPNETPLINSYSIAYTYGPIPLPNVTFHMRSAKIIGSGPPIVYKYDADYSTGASASLILPQFEPDTLTITVPTIYDIASSCSAQPEYVAPGSNTNTYLYLTPNTTHSLLVDVSSGGVYIPGATVILSKSGMTPVTATTDGCGQVFFPGLSLDTYNLNITAPSFPAANPTVDVSGTTRYSAAL